MKIIILPLLLIFMASAQAEIYRWVDANGNVVFSDEPHPQAEVIDLPASTVYTPVQQTEPEVLKLAPEDDEQTVFPDELAISPYQLRIIAPADDESIWVNNGNVSVSVIIEPELNAARGDKIRLELDGTLVGSPQALTTVELNNLDRGSHSLTASVIDGSGAVLATSETITFHLHRASRK